MLLRYVTGQLGSAVVFGLVAIGAFMLAADLMGNLAGELRDGVPVRIILQLQLLKAPDLVVQAAWVAMLAASLLVFGQMARHREYTAALASGVSIYQITLPALLVAGLLAVTVFGIQETLVPGARDAMASLRGMHDRDAEVDLRGTIANISYYSADDRAYVIGSLHVASGTARNVHMDRVVDNRIVEQMDAERGKWNPRRRRWIWSDITARTFDAEQRILTQTRERERPGRLRASPRDLRIEKRLALDTYDLAYLSLAQLRRRRAALARSAQAPAGLSVMYYAKWAEPWSTLVVALLTIPGALSIERRGLVRGVVLCVAACVAFFALRQVGLALGRGGVLPPVVAAWGPHVLAGGLGAGWLRRAPT